MSVNMVSLLGNVGKDPEIKTFESGDQIAKVSLATSEKWTDKKTGEKKEATEWHNLVFRGGIVSVVENYVKKGDKLFVTGKIKTRKWQDDSGQDRYTTEIHVRDMDLQGGGGDKAPDKKPATKKPAPAQEPIDDDIPF